MITTTWSQSLTEPVRRIREDVFIREQGLSYSEVFDAHDDGAHIVLLCDNGAPLATGRLHAHKDGYIISLISVVKPRRGERLGDMVMRLLLFKAQRLGAKCITVQSSAHALAFYRQFGFTPAQPEQESGEPVPMTVSTGEIVFPHDCANNCTQ